VAKEIFERRLNLDLVFSGDAIPSKDDFVISYGLEGADIQIPSCGLLEASKNLSFDFIWTKDNLKDEISLSQNVLSKDIFGIIFWFLSRYEEYQFEGPFDSYDRFPSSEARLNKLGLMDFPVVDFMVNSFSKILISKGLDVSSNKSDIEISFDIDNATAFREKGFYRNLLGLGLDSLTLELNRMRKRLTVLMGLEKDPFDNFDRIKFFAEAISYKPQVFFWIGDYGKNDKGLTWKNSWFQNQIKEISKVCCLGIHPSFNSFKNRKQLSTEIGRLESVSSETILNNRFHFLRFQLPESYQLLEEKNIKEDFSMGFSDIFGYRAGTGHPFYWYDLKREMATNLKVHPFVMMDSLAHFKLKLNGPQFLESVKKAHLQASQVGGKLHIIFHNEHFSWEGWEKLIFEVNELNNP
jgi:hypothetical protein